MRIALFAVALLALPSLADEPIRIRLEVGREKALCSGGTCRSPVCDNPSVAEISADGRAILRAVGAGTTRCSISTGTGRQVYEIEVTSTSSPSPSTSKSSGS